jgi:hypothetical protein
LKLFSTTNRNYYLEYFSINLEKTLLIHALKIYNLRTKNPVFYLTHLLWEVKNIEPIIKKRGPFRAVGLRYYGDDSDVVKMAPKLRELFSKRMSEVKDIVSGCAYGLMCTDMDQVSMEKWDYMACIKVRSFKDIPEGMVEVEVPE